MYKIPKKQKTSIKTNQSVEGEPIEVKIERLLNNNDESTDMKQAIYTKPEDGIIPAYNIRHDHWDDAYIKASTMAEKETDLDNRNLEKRKNLLKQQQDEEKFLKEHAKKGLTPGKDGSQEEV